MPKISVALHPKGESKTEAHESQEGGIRQQTAGQLNIPPVGLIMEIYTVTILITEGETTNSL